MTFLLLAIACTGSDKDSGDDAPPINLDTADTAVACTGSAPVIEQVVVSNGGIMTFDEGDFPTILVETTATDADNDLNLMRAELWFDAVVDGAVDTAGEKIDGAVAELRDDPCSVGRGTYGIRIAVGDARFSVNTVYEFGVIAYDAHETASAMGFGSGVTPNADGTDGTTGT